MEFEIDGKIHVVDPAEIDSLLALIAEGPGDDVTVKLGEALLAAGLVTVTPPQDIPTDIDFPPHPEAGPDAAVSPGESSVN